MLNQNREKLDSPVPMTSANRALTEASCSRVNVEYLMHETIARAVL